MYKNVKGGGRVAWLDNVKMYAMLWVILGHVMTIVIKTNVDLSGRVMEHFIVAFNMRHCPKFCVNGNRIQL